MSRLTFIQEKIVSAETAILRSNMWKMNGNNIVFTNGCFDILHRGHVTYLAKAAELGSKLIVAVNTDDSVKRLNKATNRPINQELDRALVLASLGFIDLIILFNEDTPLELIQKINPDILVKGADYDAEEADSKSKKYIVGSDFIKKNGGKVTTVALEEGFSTTSLIAKMKS
ncbi:MAG: adenylyltransferase/cytidyltransferase family protein [Flavobacteriia bacterium]|jgi:rfaE bifunctional protein nucleotidyltransferase chain/domain